VAFGHLQDVQTRHSHPADKVQQEVDGRTNRRIQRMFSGQHCGDSTFTPPTTIGITTFGIKDAQHNNKMTIGITTFDAYVDCRKYVHFADCHQVECRGVLLSNDI
jgi:hypothetical protein